MRCGRVDAGGQGDRGECGFFYPPRAAETGRLVRPGTSGHGVAAGTSAVWFDAIQRLIAHGHRFPDILGYTLAQLRAFLGAIERGDATQDARLLTLLTLGARGDAHQLDKALDRLTEQAQKR